jgi:hypothetical protein
MKLRSFLILYMVIFLFCQFSLGSQVPTDRLETSEIEQKLPQKVLGSYPFLLNSPKNTCIRFIFEL